MKKIIQKLVEVLVGFWISIVILWFIAGIACHGLSYAGVRMVSPKIRFPLSVVSSLAIDKEGRVLVYTTWLCRLQVFSAEGHFLRGWFVHSSFPSPDASAMYVDPNEQIHLALSLGHLYIFDIEGNILEYRKEEGVLDLLLNEDTPRAQATDAKGNVYRAQHGVLSTRIIKIGPLGNKSTVIADPFYLAPFRGHLAMITFFLPLFVIGFSAAMWRENKGKEQEPERSEDVTIS